MGRGLENLKIFKLAERLEIFVHKATKLFPPDEKFRSVDQLRRSSSSVTDNISEAYNRYHFQDKINRLLIARGEAGETRSGIVKAGKKELVSLVIAQFTYDKYTELIKGINGYIKFLRDKKEKSVK